MTSRSAGSGSASAKTVFDRTVAEAVRQSRRLGQTDASFVPPSDAANSMIAAQMFTGHPRSTAEGPAQVADASAILAAEMFTRSAVTGAGASELLTFGTHLTAGDSSYDGSAPATITSDATAANTANTLMARDGAGSFAAQSGAFSADVSAPGGTGTFLHLVAGDITVPGGGVVNAGSSTGTFLHLASGDITVTTMTGTSTAVSCRMVTSASTTARAGFNIQAGTAPTAPVDGDIWSDGTHLYWRVAGVTKQLDN